MPQSAGYSVSLAFCWMVFMLARAAAGGHELWRGGHPLVQGGRVCARAGDRSQQRRPHHLSPLCRRRGGAGGRRGTAALGVWRTAWGRGPAPDTASCSGGNTTIPPSLEWQQLDPPVARYEDTASCVGSSSSVSLCDDLAICGTRSCSWAGGSRQTRRQVSRHPTLC